MNIKKQIIRDLGVKINRKNIPVIKKTLRLFDILNLKTFFNNKSQKKVSYNSNALGIPIIIILGSGIIS